MSSLMRKLVELDELGHTDEILKMIEDLDEAQLVNAVKSRLMDPSAPRGLALILSNLAGTKHRQKRVNLIKSVVEEIPKQANLTTTQVRGLSNSVLVELENLDNEALVKLVGVCTDQMNEPESGSEMWKEMLPQLLLILKDKPVVTHCGHEMSGSDYRGQVVSSLCNAQWRPDALTIIAAMFREVPTVGEEFTQIVNKLLDGLKELGADEVPPFVYQMLRLAGQKHFLLVLMHVQRHLEQSTTGSVQGDADSIETFASQGTVAAGDIRQSECTVLFHVQKCCVQEPLSSKNLSASLTQLAFCPEIIFGQSTFLLSAVLAICGVEFLKEKFMAILVSALMRGLQDQELRRRHIWMCTVLTSQDQMVLCLKKLVNGSDLQRGVMLEQFVHFCFEVLATRRAPDAALTTATEALLHVVKRQPDATGVILEKLVARIVQGDATPHLLRCLRRLVAATPARLLAKSEFISARLLEQLANMRPAAAEASVSALVPLLSRCDALCDGLVLNLRKAINRPQPAVARMAVAGLLTLLQRLRVRRFTVPGSQAASSTSSVCSQMTGEFTLHGGATSKNIDVLHLELLQILSRALSSPAEVRLRLYEGVHELVTLHPQLSGGVLSLLMRNLERYRKTDGTEILNLERCVKDTLEEDVQLVEPLGHLVFAAAMVLNQLRKEDELDSTAEQVATFMEALVTRMSKVTPTDFGHDKDTLTIEEGAKGERKVAELNLAVAVCEALIGHMIQHWADTKVQSARKIQDLFQTIISIQDHLKGCKRPTKKKDLNASTQGGSQAGNPRKRGRPAAGSSTGPGKEKWTMELGGVSLGPVIDLPCLNLLLQLLFCDDVDWADENQTSILQNQSRFVSWVLGVVLQTVGRIRSAGAGLLDKAAPEFAALCSLGRTLFGFLGHARLQELMTEASEAGSTYLEALSELVSLLQQDNPSLCSLFIAACGNGNEADSVAEIIGHLLKLLGDLLTTIENNDDAQVKKLPRLILSLLNLMLHHLDHENPATEMLVKWLQRAARERSCDDEHIVRSIFELLLAAGELRGRSFGALSLLARDLQYQLGPIDDETADGTAKKLEMITEAHAGAVVNLVCTHIRRSLELFDVVVQRLRSERCLQPYRVDPTCAQIYENVGVKEGLVGESLCNTLDVVKILLNTKMEVPQGEALLRDVCAIYRSATAFCRHFAKCASRLEPSAMRRSKLHSVVSSAGRNLPPMIVSFISHLEDRQKSKYEEMQAKSRFNARVAQRKLLRESDTFARALLENERFSKMVFQLSAKLKDPSLKDCLHLGLCHDFRLNYDELARKIQDLEQEEGSNNENEDDD